MLLFLDGLHYHSSELNSMPSYENALKSEVNSNLKGDNYLLGEASKNYASTTTTKR